MATQELTLKIGANDAALKSVLADVRNQYGRTITEITDSTKAVASQMNAMWAARTREINAELSKQAQIEKAYASVEVETARTAQREVAAAYSQRQREVEAKAKSEVAAWAQHEAQKVAATRSAEKHGEAAVAQANAAKAKSSKQSEDQRTRDAKAAANERKRAEESLQKQRSAALIAIWKAEEREKVRLAKEAQREIERAAAESQRRRGAFISGAVGGLTALLGVSAVSEIRAAGAAMLDYASTLETTRIAFTTMLGSAQLAEQHLKDLQAFALKTPFQFAELIDASQRMQALGFNAAQVIPILTDVGNAVAAAGGGSERLDRVILAISQIQSKGKVATQELNQLAESGISGFGILEKQLGKTRAELVKMVEDGEISSKVFLDAFQKFSQQNFGGLMEAQSKTFSGAMSNIKDALLQTSNTAFAPLYEKLSKLANSFSEASQKSDEFKGKMESVGGIVITIADGFIELVHVVKDAYSLVMTALVAQLDVVTAAFSGLVRSVHAAVYALLALSKAARGDFIGAFIAMERAQRLSEIAVNDLTHAANAQMAVVREMGRIWEDAAARTRRAAADIAFSQAVIGVGKATGQQNVGGGSAGESAAAPATPADAKKKVGKGADPAISEQRLAVLQLQRTLANIAEEERVTERSLKNRQIAFEAYAEAVELKEAQRHQAVLGGLLEEAKAADKLRDAKQKEIQLTEIGNKRIEEGNRHQAAKDKLTDAQRKIEAEISEFIREQSEAIREAAAQTDKWTKAVNDLVVSLAKQGVTLNPQIEQQLRLNAQLQRTGEILREIRETLESMPPILPPGTAGEGLSEDAIAAIAGAKASAEAGALPDLTELSTRQVAALDVMSEAFAGLADAASSAVDAFIKFGSAGTSFRKFVAEILSGVARMAIVKAIFELAEGFAALAMAFFGIPNAGPSAQAHFTAAAIYGSIAGVAAIAARGAAGGAYSKDAGQASGAFNSATGGGRGGSTSSSAPKTTEADRRSYNAQPIVRELRLTVNGDAVIDRFVEDFDLNGRTRIIVSSGG